MSFSMNEVEATAKRAARGAGYSWGLADEAGKATRWLCTQGLDGSGELARILGKNLAASPADHVPRQLNGVWANERSLCSLATGALLSECAHLLKMGSVQMENVLNPLFLLPFAAKIACHLNAKVTIECDGLVAITDGSRLQIPHEFLERAENVFVRTGGSLTAACKVQTRATPAPESWTLLNSFAHRTYAPATEESRLLGAGSGLSDDD